MKVTCQHCGRYQFTATGNVMIQEAPCAGCGAKNNYKIIISDSVPILHAKATVEETPPKKIKNTV